MNTIKAIAYELEYYLLPLREQLDVVIRNIQQGKEIDPLLLSDTAAITNQIAQWNMILERLTQ